jgi:hypothetical protein
MAGSAVRGRARQLHNMGHRVSMDEHVFEWGSSLHLLIESHTAPTDGGSISEAGIGPPPLRLYTDHRVSAQIVLPGASHVGLMAAACLSSHRCRRQVSVTDALFARPFFVSGEMPAESWTNSNVSIAHGEMSIDCAAPPSWTVAGCGTPQCAENTTQDFYSMFRSSRSVHDGPQTAQGPSLPFRIPCVQLSVGGVVIVFGKSLGAAIDGADISITSKSIDAAVCESFEARPMHRGKPHA